MENSFKKFKNKIVLEALIKSVALSLSLGIITFSIPFIYYKITGIDYNLLNLVLISLGVLLLALALTLLVFMPSKKKIARRIDNELNLNEKVQTYVEYLKKDGYLVSLQREDTLNILSNISIKKLTMKFSVVFIVVCVIALISGVTAIAVPGFEEETPCEIHVDDNLDGVCDVCGESVPIDPDFDLDDWTIRAIKDIIKYVEESHINENLKSKYVQELNDLIAQLEIIEKDSEMKLVVKSTIATLELELDKVNTNNEVNTVLKDSDTDAIRKLGNQLDLLNLESLNNALDGLIYLISGSSDAITELDASFGELLRKSNLNKEDSLYKAMIKLTEDLSGCINAANVNDAVIEVVYSNKVKIIEIASDQKDNKDVFDYIERELIEIFGISDESNSDKEDEDNVDNNGGDPNEDDGKNDDLQEGNQGGLGTGETLFGSNEEFFDPEEGKVVYGDVITGYFGNINEKFSDGVIPEELREFFEKYYNILFGDKKDNE